ncbi:uncharacterized protein LOC142219719 [Haematobia irritans]|uniref:uncharacterized protein LOC142219719 n=1 Tax=Haematobia irritans TaxID=7368 RepID=UPI003F4F7E76
MTKFIVVLLVLSMTMIFAERPEWYPENAAELEVNCMKDHNVTPEIVAKIRSFHLDDTPEIRDVVYCSAKAKNIYRPGVGFEPERFVLGVRESVKMDCNINYIRSCGEKHKYVQPEKSMYFNVLKCIFEDLESNCKKIA